MEANHHSAGLHRPFEPLTTPDSLGWLRPTRRIHDEQTLASVALRWLGAPQKGRLVNLRFIIFPNFPYIQICLLVWDSGLQRICDNRGTSRGTINCRFTSPLFGSTELPPISSDSSRPGPDFTSRRSNSAETLLPRRRVL